MAGMDSKWTEGYEFQAMFNQGGDHFYAKAFLEDDGICVYPDRRGPLPVNGGVHDMVVTKVLEQKNTVFARAFVSRDGNGQVLPPAYAFNWHCQKRWPTTGQPCVEVFVRAGRTTIPYQFLTEDAGRFGCPIKVIEQCNDWVKGVQHAVANDVYKPLEEGNVKANMALIYENAMIERDMVDNQWGLLGLHWLENPLGELTGLGTKILIANITGQKGLEKALWLAKIRKARLLSVGVWSSTNGEPSFRSATDPALYKALDLVPPDAPLDDPQVMPESYGTLLDLGRPNDPYFPAYYHPEKWYGSFTGSHRAWVDLAGEVQEHWFGKPDALERKLVASVGIDTALEQPVAEDGKYWLPWGWGYVLIAAHAIQSYTENPMIWSDGKKQEGKVVVLEGENQILLCAPYNTSFRACLQWNGKMKCQDGSLQTRICDYDGPVSITNSGWRLAELPNPAVASAPVAVGK